MTDDDRIVELQAFIDERWSIAQPRFYPAVLHPPRVHPALSRSEAEWFLASVTANNSKPPLVRIDDERTMRSDRFPPRADGLPLAYHFFEAPGRLRLETIVHLAAAARLEREFGWPRQNIVIESPAIVDDEGSLLLHRDALDLLLLERPCPELKSKMSPQATTTRVAVETKATARLAERLIRLMRTCTASDHPEHEKCLALQVLRPRLFLLIAAGTWRVFAVVDRDGQAVLGDELLSLKSLNYGGAPSR